MPRYIDADKVVKWSYSEPRYSDSVNDRTDLRDFLLSLPTVSPDKVRGVGEWLNDVGEFGFPEIPCSVCGYKSGHYGFKYCPSCGAKMKGAEVEDGTTDNS